MEEMTTEQKQAVALASARLRIQPGGIMDDPRMKGLVDIAKAVDEAPNQAGGAVTDFAAKAGASPEVSAGLGYGTNVGLQAAPMAVGGAAKVAGSALRGGAEYLMQSALKPSLRQLKSGEAATAIDTMLSEGINATKGGVDILKKKIGEINEQIATAIKESPERVDTNKVWGALRDTMKKFEEQVNPQMDVNTIKNAWEMFKNHPLLNGADSISVQMAQALKQGTYKILAKKYGQMGTAEIEAQKALARGLKDEVASAIPGIAELNLKDSQLISALNVTEKRALMDMNRNPGGLALLTHNPTTFIAYMADKSALFKSLVARMLNIASKEPVLASAGRAGIAGYEASNQE